MKNSLKIYTIYDSPKDLPNTKYAIRRRLISVGKNEVDPTFLVQSDDLETCREMMIVSFGLTCLGREPDDDPIIVESWM